MVLTVEMDESSFLSVPTPLNLYGVCKVWHTGVLKVLVGSEGNLWSATSWEEEGRLNWNFEKEPVLELPDKSQVISIATANPLMIGKRNESGTGARAARRCLLGVTFCVPTENTPPEPEPVPVAKSAPARPAASSNSYVSRILQTARPPPQAQNKQIETAPQVFAPPRFYFSILGANSFETDHWSTIVQDNITFELPYIPFVLAKFAPQNSSHVLFLLSGSDRKLHIFNQHADTQHVEPSSDAQPAEQAQKTDTTDSAQKVSQTDLHAPTLPLLDYYPSPVVSIDVIESPDGLLHVIAGCQDGSLVFTSGGQHNSSEPSLNPSSGASSTNDTSHTATTSPLISKQFITVLDGPITSVKIYQVSKAMKQRRSTYTGSNSFKDEGGVMIQAENDQTHPKAASSHPSVRRLNKHIHRSSSSSSPSHLRHSTPPAYAINIVVASAVGFAAVFRNVTENGFNDFHLLPDSDKHDAVLGIAVGDVDQDGHTEILIGTYGQRILAYAETKTRISPSSSLPTLEASSISTPQREIDRKAKSDKKSVVSEISPTRAPQPSAAPSNQPNQPSMPSALHDRKLLTPLPTRVDSPGLRQASASIQDLVDSTDGPETRVSEGEASKKSGELHKSDSFSRATPAVDSPSTSPAKDLSSVGMGFARLLDEKKQEYMRENVVSSVPDASHVTTSSIALESQRRGDVGQDAALATNASGSTAPVAPDKGLFGPSAAHVPSFGPSIASHSSPSINHSVKTEKTPHKGHPHFELKEAGNGSSSTPSSHHLRPSSSMTSLDDAEQEEAQNAALQPSFSLLWRKSFTHPVYQIMCDDFLADGTISVVASTMYGLHLLRTNSTITTAKALSRLQLLSDIVKLERQIYRMEKKVGSASSSPAVNRDFGLDLRPPPSPFSDISSTNPSPSPTPPPPAQSIATETGLEKF